MADPLLNLKDRMQAQALAEGFALVRVCAPNAIPLAPDRLSQFVDA